MGKQNFSFDIVSEVNLQEVDNAVNQTKKEMSQRYDFKNTKSSLNYDKSEKKITLIADDDFKLRAIKDMLAGRLAKRGISFKSLNYKEPEKSFEGTLRQIAEITTGLSKEKAKNLIKIIKQLNLKVQAQVENEKIKVSAPKKDDLQKVISHVKKIDFPLPLSFCNYR